MRPPTRNGTHKALNATAVVAVAIVALVGLGTIGIFALDIFRGHGVQQIGLTDVATAAAITTPHRIIAPVTFAPAVSASASGSSHASLPAPLKFAHASSSAVPAYEPASPPANIARTSELLASSTSVAERQTAPAPLEFADRWDGGGVLATLGRPDNQTPIRPVALSLVSHSGKLLAAPSAPPLELQREQHEAASPSTQSASEVTFSSNFECGTPIEVHKLSSTHYAIKIPNRRFLFQVSGAAGKTLRIDLVHPVNTESPGNGTNPLISYATDLSAIDTYHVSNHLNAYPASTAWNGAILPSTEKQSWHFVPSVWIAEPNTISMVYSFAQDHAFIAMRVPRPPSYNQRYLSLLAAHPAAKLITVGQTRQGRNLSMIKISGGEDAERSDPCVLIYAGEHADEPDAMWVAEGAIDSLGGCDTALKLPQHFTFLIIPNLDPDASAAAMHSQILAGFMTKTEKPENSLYANWFEAWVNSGKRLDLVLDLHCGGFSRPAQVACALMEGLESRGSLSIAMNDFLAQGLRASGLTVESQPWERGWSPDRLGGWLSRRFGPLTLAYEVDTQSTVGHLNLTELKSIGEVFVERSLAFLKTDDGTQLMANTDARRHDRLVRMTKYGSTALGTDAITAEAATSKGVGLRKSPTDEVFVERWVP